MANSKKFEMILALNMLPHLDKGQANKAIKEFETAAKGMKVEFDPSKAKQGINDIINNFQKLDVAASQLENVFNNFEVYLNTDEAKKAMRDLEKQINGIDLSGAFDNIGTDELQKVQNALQELLKNADTQIDLDFQLDERGKAEFEKFKKEISSIQDKKTKLGIDTEAADVKINKLTEDISKVEDKKAKISITMEDTDKKIAEYKTKLATIEDKKFKLEIEPTKANEEIKSIQANIEKLENKKAKLEIDSSDADKRIGNIKDSIGKIQDKKAKIEIDSNEAETELKQVQTKIQELGQTKVQIDPLANLNPEDLARLELVMQEAFQTADVQKFQNEIDQLSDSYDRLQKSATEDYDKQKKALQIMKMTGQESTEEYKRLEKELAKTEKQLDSLGNAGNDTKEKLSFADKLATAGLAMQGIEQMTQAIGEISVPYVELDKATQTMMTLGDEAKAMAPKMREASLVMSKELPFSAAEMQSAMTDALASGVKGGEEGIQNFAETAAKLATGGGASLESVVKGLSGTINAFGDTSEKSGQYADQMFNIVNFGVATIEELNSSMSQVTPTAASIGVSFGQVGGAIALMTQKGIPAAQATTKLNALMLEMAKPSAGITASLKAAGVSQEQFAKSIKEKGLVSALETLQDGFTKTGKTATQAFSSSEAGAAFNSLMSDAEALKQSMKDVEGTTGSAQKAYEEMSKSIDVRTKQFKATLDSAFVGLIDSMGSVGPAMITVAQSFGQIAPAVTALTGISTVFGGVAGKALDFGKTIANSVIPNLFKQAAATEGANVAQMKFNASALLNPYVLGAAAIAGVVAGIKLLSSALYDTAQEQLDAAKAQDELMNKQIQAKQQEIGIIESKQNLIKTFKESGAAAMDNKKLMLELAESYPGVISSNKSYEENLKALEGQSGKTTQQLGTLKNELGNLAQQKVNLQVKMSNLEIGVEKQKIEDELQKAIGLIGDDAMDWLVGTSNARQTGEQLIKPYTDAMYNAKDSKELEKATIAFQMAIFNDKKFKDLSDEQKGKVIENIEKMSKARADALEKNSKGIVSEYDTLKKSPLKEGEIIDFLAKKYKTSKGEVEGLVKKQEEAKKVTEEQKRSVEGLAESWNKAKKEASDSLSNQKAAYLQQQSEIEEIRKKNPEQVTTTEMKQLSEWNSKKKTLISDMVKENKELKNKEKQEQALEKYLNPPVTAKKDLLELIKQEIDRKNLSLEIDKMIYDQALQDKLLKEDRKATAEETVAQETNNLKILEKQKQVIVDAYKAKGLVTVDASGNIEVAKKDAKQIEQIEKEKAKAIAELDKELKSGKIKDNEEYQRKLDETTLKFEDMKFKIKPATAQEIQKSLLAVNAQIQAGNAKVKEVKLTAKLDKKAVEQAVTDLKLSTIEYEVEIGVRKAGDYSDVIDDYVKFGEQLKTELDAINAKAQTDPEKEKQATEKENQILENNKKIWGFKLKALETQYAEEDRIKAKADKKQEKDLAKTDELQKRFMDIYSGKTVAKLDADYSGVVSGLDKALEQEKKLLDEDKADGLISEESYNIKLAQIQDKYANEKADKEEEYRRNKVSLDAIASGMSAEQERVNELDKLKKKKKELDVEIARAMSMGDVKKADELKDQLEETEGMLKEKGDVLTSLVGDISGTMADTMAELFTGDTDAIADSWREYFGQLAGKLKAMLSAFVLEMILSESTLKYLSALPFPLNIAAVPVIKTTIQSAISALADPLLKDITSFSTGGEINSPTLALVGDGAKLGSDNKEWIFRNDQLKQVIQMANGSGTAILEQRLASIENLIASLELFTVTKGSEIKTVLARNENFNNSRAF